MAPTPSFPCFDLNLCLTTYGFTDDFTHVGFTNGSLDSFNTGPALRVRRRGQDEVRRRTTEPTR